jgi:hypothetical protein
LKTVRSAPLNSALHGSPILMKKILLAIIVGLALTVLFYAVGAFLSGGGHNLNVITAFFPYSLSLGTLTEQTRWTRGGSFIAGALLVVQFPIYAIVFAISKRMPWKWPLIIVLSLHFLAVIIGLRIYHESRFSYLNRAIQYQLTRLSAPSMLSARRRGPAFGAHN